MRTEPWRKPAGGEKQEQLKTQRNLLPAAGRVASICRKGDVGQWHEPRAGRIKELAEKPRPWVSLRTLPNCALQISIGDARQMQKLGQGL